MKAKDVIRVLNDRGVLPHQESPLAMLDRIRRWTDNTISSGQLGACTMSFPCAEFDRPRDTAGVVLQLYGLMPIGMVTSGDRILLTIGAERLSWYLTAGRRHYWKIDNDVNAAAELVPGVRAGVRLTESTWNDVLAMFRRRLTSTSTSMAHTHEWAVRRWSSRGRC